MTRAQARADVMRMLDGTGVGASLFAIAPDANREPPSRSVHSMQQQPRREDLVEYYERRAREAQLQADARKGEVYDDDLDTWRQGDPGDECSCAVCGRAPLTCPSCRGLQQIYVAKSEPDERGWDRVTKVLCGPMGRVAA